MTDHNAVRFSVTWLYKRKISRHFVTWFSKACELHESGSTERFNTSTPSIRVSNSKPITNNCTDAVLISGNAKTFWPKGSKSLLIQCAKLLLLPIPDVCTNCHRWQKPSVLNSGWCCCYWCSVGTLLLLLLLIVKFFQQIQVNSLILCCLYTV